MSTGLFADEEDGYNLEEVETIEETKFKLKVPNGEPSAEDSIEGLEGGEELDGLDGLEGLEGGEEALNDKPFDDEPFEAGVEADEESDPKTYIQQLSGKLGQSLRAYSDEQGQPDFDLEKFAVNSVLSATHTGQMDNEDQSDIIKKVKSSGNDGGDIDVNVDVDTDADNVDVNAGDEGAPEGGGEDFDFGDEEVTEEGIELGIPPHNPEEFEVDDVKRYYDGIVTRSRDGITGRVVRFDGGKLKIKITDGPHSGKIFYASPTEVELQSKENFNLGEGKTQTKTLDKSEKKRIFVSKEKIMSKLNERNEVEPTVKPKVKPANPDVKPSRRQKPFRPTIQPKTEPKAKVDGVLSEDDSVSGKILGTKYLDSKIAILTVALGDGEVDIKFENTHEYLDKPLSYDEPWVYSYDTVEPIDGQNYSIGVEFFGHPDTNLDLSGIEDDYIQTV